MVSKYIDIKLVLIIPVLFYVLGFFCLSLGTVEGTASPFWLPTGLVVFSAVSYKEKSFLPIFIGEFFAGIFSMPGPMWKHLLIALGNVSEAFAIIYCVTIIGNKFKTSNLFLNTNVFLSFALLLIPCFFINGFIGTTAIRILMEQGDLSFNIFNSIFVDIFTNWVIGDLGGAIIIFPLLYALKQKVELDKELQHKKNIEFIMVTALVSVLSVVVFLNTYKPIIAIYGFLLLGVFLYSALRLSFIGVTVQNFILMIVAVSGTSRNLGPFIYNNSIDSLMVLQGFTGTLLIISLLIMISEHEKKKLEMSLRELTLNLENEVDKRTSELNSALQLSNAANYEKDRFLATINHEIRTPMNGILGLSKMVLATDAPQNIKELLVNINNSSYTLMQILNDILDYSKIQSGDLNIAKEKFIIKDLTSSLGLVFVSLAVEKGLEYKIKCDLPENYIFSHDKTRLLQVLGNLIGNAIKYTNKGHVEINVELVGSFENIKKIRFSVIDSGVGISESDIGKLGVPFTQLNNSSTREHGGSGLGLAICKKIMLAMDSDLNIESRIGVGTKVWFDIDMEHVGNSDIVNGQVEVAGGSIVKLPTRPQKILIVEDNKINRIILGEFVKNMGFTVCYATNGLEALDLLKETLDVNLILMDVDMPNMDGLTATETIRSGFDGISKYTAIPIIIVSAGVSASDVSKCYKSGANDFIAKPVNPEDLLIKINKYIKV